MEHVLTMITMMAFTPAVQAGYKDMGEVSDLSTNEDGITYDFFRLRQ